MTVNPLTESSDHPEAAEAAESGEDAAAGEDAEAGSSEAPRPGLSGTITGLEVQARDQSRVNLYLDGRFAFGLSAKQVTEAGLRKGDHLTVERVTALLQGEARERALQQAFNYLSYRPRSTQELRRYLEGKGYAPETIAGVLEKLAGYHYVDDEVFALNWVENRQRFRPTGPHLLRAELRQKGVSREISDQAISDVLSDERALAKEAAARRAASLAGQDYATFSRRLGGFLSRRGFSPDIVWDTVRECWATTSQHAAPDDTGNREDPGADDLPE